MFRNKLYSQNCLTTKSCSLFAVFYGWEHKKKRWPCLLINDGSTQAIEDYTKRLVDYRSDRYTIGWWWSVRDKFPRSYIRYIVDRQRTALHFFHVPRNVLKSWTFIDKIMKCGQEVFGIRSYSCYTVICEYFCDVSTVERFGNVRINYKVLNTTSFHKNLSYIDKHWHLFSILPSTTH